MVPVPAFPARLGSARRLGAAAARWRRGGGAAESEIRGLPPPLELPRSSWDVAAAPRAESCAELCRAGPGNVPIP